MATIEIRLEGGSIVVPDKTKVGNGWHVRWTCKPDADFRIEFGEKEGSPFEDATKSLDKAAAMTARQIFKAKVSELREFKYSVHANGIELDPVIIVDPDESPE